MKEKHPTSFLTKLRRLFCKHDDYAYALTETIGSTSIKGSIYCVFECMQCGHQWFQTRLKR